MRSKGWLRIAAFGMSAALSGFATIAATQKLADFELHRLGWTLVVAGTVLLVGLGRLLTGYSVRHWAMVAIPFVQALFLTGIVTGRPGVPAGWLGYGYWVLECLNWTIRLSRCGAAAREVDRYPGLVVAIVVIAWLAGGLVSVLSDSAAVVAVGGLLLAGFLSSWVRWAHETAGPEALPAWPARWQRIVPSLRLASRRDAAEAAMLLVMLAGVCLAGGEGVLAGREVSPAEVLAAMATGMVTLVVGNHPYRVAGWLPYAAWAMLVAIASRDPHLAEQRQAWSVFLTGAQTCAAMAICSRLVAICPPASFAGWAGLASLVAGLAFVGVGQGPEWVVAGNTWPGWLMLGLGVLAQVYWLREWLELTAALPAFFLYRIRHGGPGRAWIPWRGPLLVIANHAAWFDPLWLGKVIPRRLTPMMTSDFYDLPGLYWLMRYVLRVIRVEEAHARREAPELDEAVKRLAAGECVVIFPEGRLRREEDRMLAPFQRGIWYILQKSPDTPVVPCWIEGNWGSYFSWKDGPPMKNKPFDWCRRITIVVGHPRVLSGEVLADHRTTRRFLEQLVLEQRQYLHQK
jgi:1-acyl-sn-glycerol-3-phosphate acyltransferase